MTAQTDHLITDPKELKVKLLSLAEADRASRRSGIDDPRLVLGLANLLRMIPEEMNLTEALEWIGLSRGTLCNLRRRAGLARPYSRRPGRNRPGKPSSGKKPALESL